MTEPSPELLKYHNPADVGQVLTDLQNSALPHNDRTARYLLWCDWVGHKPQTAEVQALATNVPG